MLSSESRAPNFKFTRLSSVNAAHTFGEFFLINLISGLGLTDVLLFKSAENKMILMIYM